MKRRPRIIYTAQQRALMWERYQKGSSLNDIARLFERHHSSVSRIIGESGGIRPNNKQRAKNNLTLDEREEISRGISACLSMRAIASKRDRPLQRYAVKLIVTVVTINIVRYMLIKLHGIEQNDPKPASYL